MQRKPKCDCGTCNVCRTRVRMRKLRQTKTVNEAKSDHVRATVPLAKSTPAFNQRVRWLLACPSGDVNFRTNLEKATLEELEYVQKRYKRSSFKSKDGTRRINAQLNRLMKADAEALNERAKALGQRQISPTVAKVAKKYRALRAAVIDNSKGRPELEPVTKLSVQERSSSRPADNWPTLKKHLTKNLAVWVNGNDKYSDDGNLEDMIEARASSINREVETLQDLINRHHQKPKRNGILYWYLWNDGTWRYCGRKDPRPPLEAQKLKLEEKAQEAGQLMRSCVIKELGDHLVIDIRKFQEHVDKRLPGNIIRVSEILA